MVSTVNVRHYRKLYESLPDATRQIIDDAFKAAYDSFKTAGLSVANDDRAEEIERKNRSGLQSKPSALC